SPFKVTQKSQDRSGVSPSDGLTHAQTLKRRRQCSGCPRNRIVMRIKSYSLVLMLLCTVFAGMGFAKSFTSVTLSSSLNPSTYGSAVTFTARVSPSGATGTVTFMDGTSTLTGGSHSITGVYSGDSAYNGSTSSPPLTQTVNKVNSSVALTSNLNPS